MLNLIKSKARNMAMGKNVFCFILAAHICNPIGLKLYNMLKYVLKCTTKRNFFQMVISSICFVEILNEKQILVIALGDSHAKKIQHTKNYAN